MSTGTALTCSVCGSSVDPGARFCGRCGTALHPGVASSVSEVSPWDEVLERLRKVTLDEFQIVGELGRGGMAAVYLAHDIALNRKVAIKVMSPGLLLGAGMAERFRQEASTVANLSHPHIVTMHAVRQAGGLQFFVMKLIPGRSLEQVMKEVGPLPVPLVQAILFQVGSALAFAHRRGVIHRDIKPSNILFDEDGNAVLTDFGIARVVESPRQTQTGTTIGTPTYMSPEQCSSREVTSASDQYSLGIVAYEMLAGTPPFQGPTLAILRAHTEDPPPPLRQLRPDIPETVAAAVARMLAKQPQERFGNVMQAVADLGGHHLAEGDPLRARLAELGARRGSRAMDLATPGSPIPVIALRDALAPPAAGPVASPGGFPDVVAERGAEPARAPGHPPRLARPNRLGRMVAWLSRRWYGRRPSDPIISTAEPIVVTAERPIKSAPRSAENSTQPFRAPDWAPAPEAMPHAAQAPGGSTQVLATSGSDSADLLFPVALSVTASLDPTQVGLRLRCDHFPFTVGRGATSDLCLRHDSALSRSHCEIDRDASGFLIRDLSMNGLYVNGRHLHREEVPIPFGAQIALSKLTALTFVADIPMLPLLTGQTLHGRYRLGQLVHESIKAATYIAEDLGIPKKPRLVAMKIFSPSLMQLASYREEVERQATLAGNLQHPHICKVLDFGEATLMVDGHSQRVCYLCTDCMPGGNLESRLGAGPPTLALAGQWIQKLADALEHVHRDGVVHGDLKPTCIVFDRAGTPYLTDFALARGGDAATRSVLGAPDYLAPEQWEGQPPTGATDQYSLAVLAYMMITGALPHEGQYDPAVRTHNFLHGPPLAEKAASSAGREAVSHNVSLVLAKALSVTPADRYATVGEFSRKLGEAIANPGRQSVEPRIFMSYHRQSSAGWANLFAHHLKQEHGYSVFIDTQAQDGAPQIPDRLRHEITACDVFVCMLSSETLKSRWVRQEIGIAFECRKPMVPVFHEGFRPKDEGEAADAAVRALLDYAAVHLLDRQNIYVGPAIDELAERVRKLLP